MDEARKEGMKVLEEAASMFKGKAIPQRDLHEEFLEAKMTMDGQAQFIAAHGEEEWLHQVSLGETEKRRRGEA